MGSPVNFGVGVPGWWRPFRQLVKELIAVAQVTCR